MPGACRLTDIHLNPNDVCGCVVCPHSTSGIVMTGSPNVFADNLNAFRGQFVDIGDHSLGPCCGPNLYNSTQCSPDVIVNGVGWVRLGDMVTCCGGVGNMITASIDVIIN